MNWDEFSSRSVKIDYANMSEMNKIRAWARRNNAFVSVQRYARDAYSGFVKVPMKQGLDQQTVLVRELQAIIG